MTRAAYRVGIGALVLLFGGILLWPAASTRLALFRAARELRQTAPGGGFLWLDSDAWTERVGRTPDSARIAAAVLARIDGVDQQLGRNSRSLTIRGRAYVLQGRFEDAIRILRTARNLSPADLDAAAALGIAYGLRAQAEDRASDLGHALEEFLSVAQTHPGPIYANAARICERIPAPHSAIRHWQLALDHAKASQRPDIEARLAALRKKVARDQRVRAVLEQPPSPDDPPGTDDVRLQHAIRVSLAADATPPGDGQALANHLEQQRGDRLWKDFHQRPIPVQARKDLAAAAKANLEGDHETALGRAQTAMQRFLAAGNPAGRTLSALEAAYALQRQANASQCLETLQGMRESAMRSRWVWAAHRAWFEELTCKTQLRRVNVMEEREDAARIIPQSGYAGLGLRARAIVAEPFRSLTAPGQAWQNAHQSLKLFWESVLPPNLASNLYVPLALACQNTGKPLTGALLIRETVDVLATHPNPSLKAQILIELGSMQLNSRKYQEAAATFHEAGIIGRGAIDTRQTDGLADLAAAQQSVHAGKRADALARLRNLVARDPFPYRSFSYYDRLRLLPAVGTAFAAVGQSRLALEHFQLGVRESRERVAALNQEDQRQTLLRESEASWRGLVQTTFEAGNHEQALALWQEFRSARTPEAAPASADPRIAWLSYALLQDSIVVWSSRNRSTRAHRIAASQLLPLADRFSSLLADPDAPEAEVRRMARDLYDWLIAPMEDAVRGASTLVIDADGPLARIPWPALEARGGQVVADRHATVQAYGWREAQIASAARPVRLQPALLVSEPAIGGNLRRHFPPLPEARREALWLQQRLPRARHLSGSEATLDALVTNAPNFSLFHFAGHGVSNGGFGALVLAGDERQPVRLLTSREISRLDLRNLDLVLLSSCSSGTGESGGVLDVDSLVRAFLQAGAARVLASRWDISSRAAAGLVSTFYRHLDAGIPAAEALRKASSSVRKIPTTSHPYYWTAFQLYGAP